jgi:hypothetical protein
LAFPSGFGVLTQRYVLALAIVGPLGRFLSQALIGVYVPGTVVFGTEIPGEWIRAPLAAAVNFICGVGVGVGAFALLASLLFRLAPAFGGRRDLEGSYRAAALILTPIYVAGSASVLASVPYLSALSYLIAIFAIAHAVALGLWSLPLHLGTPEEKAVGHVLAALGPTVTAALTVFGVLQWLLMP